MYSVMCSRIIAAQPYYVMVRLNVGEEGVTSMMAGPAHSQKGH
jgi:hypothetical protein